MRAVRRGWLVLALGVAPGSLAQQPTSKSCIASSIPAPRQATTRSAPILTASWFRPRMAIFTEQPSLAASISARTVPPA